MPRIKNVKTFYTPMFISKCVNVGLLWPKTRVLCICEKNDRPLTSQVMQLGTKWVTYRKLCIRSVQGDTFHWWDAVYITTPMFVLMTVLVARFIAFLYFSCVCFCTTFVKINTGP